jgi:hypothetical protein
MEEGGRQRFGEMSSFRTGRIDKLIGGPARIRTENQSIMSALL